MKMIKFDASEKRRAFRAFIWFALYYGLEIFIAAYLAQFEEITGVNAVLVFVPLIILAISTERMSKHMDGERINLRPWANVDFCAKALAFIFAQMIFRFPQNGALVIVMWDYNKGQQTQRFCCSYVERLIFVNFILPSAYLTCSCGRCYNFVRRANYLTDILIEIMGRICHQHKPAHARTAQDFVAFLHYGGHARRAAHHVAKRET